ncbi:hypothetical protein QQZ08_005441 [Neonectria magnoliae]|uniref:Major facilitator superfamily (MFS) profile domain-containing protein n=1 Tax=Neonectria magnoliae TaxID=2732573 RepID=A0ABR1I396_9HYPO
MSLVTAASSMTVGILLCSISQNLWQLAVSRAVVGLGAAGLELLVLVIVNGIMLFSSKVDNEIFKPGVRSR